LDPERVSELERPPRGSSVEGDGVEWYFWIPCGGGDRWIHFASKDHKFKGQRSAVVLDDAQVTESMKRGDLYISLKDVQGIKDIVEASKEGCRYLMELFE
jgi:hypothetical protein